MKKKSFCKCIRLYVFLPVEISRVFLFFAVSPVLAALGDPFSHYGVESLSAHMWILTVGVQQVSQGGQPLLLVTLSRHALQVMDDGGGQDFPWETTETMLYGRLCDSLGIKCHLPVLELLHASYRISRSSCSENPLLSSSSSLAPQPGGFQTEHDEISKSPCSDNFGSLGSVYSPEQLKHHKGENSSVSLRPFFWSH